ncbi:MAG TPA: glycosyltransferase [Acidobacteriaceae bacterium]|jgi:ceramide glucosyltransferase|nr:glycosyltransferase [Acidobacteriaceae bacterium]
MIRLLFDLGLFGLLTSTVAALLALAGLVHFRRNPPRLSYKGAEGAPAVEPVLSALEEATPVSLLKPLDGAEPGLEAHLESFFCQDYPNFEILFCARSPFDPGLGIARRVAARFPQIPARFLSTGEHTHINAKVSSLELMHAAAQHDIFVISDSDVRVAPGYIREVVAPFANQNVGSVTCLYRGVADGSFWSKLEAAGMSVEMTAGVLTANLLEGMKFALGPTMAVRRRSVDLMGGFGVLGPYCSDDFLLGAKVAALGQTVVLSHHVIDHIVLNLSFAASVRHQTRWMKSTRFSRPLGHLGTALTFSVPFGLLAAITGWALHRPILGLALFAFSIANRMILAALVGAGAVHERRLLRTVLLYPVRDLLGFCCWVASYGSSTIFWRGRRYRLSHNGLMHPLDTQPSEEAEHAYTT